MHPCNGTSDTSKTIFQNVWSDLSKLENHGRFIASGFYFLPDIRAYKNIILKLFLAHGWLSQKKSIVNKGCFLKAEFPK
eukprot:4693672-Amphidinium_carterae.1